MTKMAPSGAVGIVYPSEAWMFMGASTLTVDGITNRTMFEALACMEALVMAQDIQCKAIYTSCCLPCDRQ
jgi:hypothetical protein